jgi:hypothetical protein
VAGRFGDQDHKLSGPKTAYSTNPGCSNKKIRTGNLSFKKIPRFNSSLALITKTTTKLFQFEDEPTQFQL